MPRLFESLNARHPRSRGPAASRAALSRRRRARHRAAAIGGTAFSSHDRGTRISVPDELAPESCGGVHLRPQRVRLISERNHDGHSLGLGELKKADRCVRRQRFQVPQQLRSRTVLIGWCGVEKIEHDRRDVSLRLRLILRAIADESRREWRQRGCRLRRDARAVEPEERNLARLSAICEREIGLRQVGDWIAFAVKCDNGEFHKGRAGTEGGGLAPATRREERQHQHYGPRDT